MSLHHQEDGIFGTANVNEFKANATSNRKLKFFLDNVQDKTVLNKLKHICTRIIVLTLVSLHIIALSEGKKLEYEFLAFLILQKRNFTNGFFM